jgi:thiopeptide-type bacteriocin biosynthesis protein
MTKKVQRNFIVGDSWLYFKIYTGTKTADSILIEIIKPIATILLKEKIINKWFFLRYGDPKHHLRIRFHCDNINNIGMVISKFLPHLKELANQDLIWKIQTDTYQREIERYGENTIEISESIFFRNSTLIVDALEIIGGEDEELRWLFALKDIDNLLDVFKYSIDDKIVLLEHLKIGMGKEFGMNKHLNKQIDFKYRNYRGKIEEIMSLKHNENFKYLNITKIIEDFNENLSPLVTTILNHRDSNLLMVNLNNLLSSYIHMSMVRLFKSKNRMHEMLVYDFLFRYYKSNKARNVKQKILEVK